MTSKQYEAVCRLIYWLFWQWFWWWWREWRGRSTAVVVVVFVVLVVVIIIIIIIIEHHTSHEHTPCLESFQRQFCRALSRPETPKPPLPTKWSHDGEPPHHLRSLQMQKVQLCVAIPCSTIRSGCLLAEIALHLQFHRQIQNCSKLIWYLPVRSNRDAVMDDGNMYIANSEGHLCSIHFKQCYEMGQPIENAHS